MAANGIFWGGAAFVTLDAVIGYGRGRSFKRVLCVGIFAFASIILMSYFGSRGSSELKADGIKVDFKMLGDDFHGYCTGARGSLHAAQDFNLCAMFEWFLLSSITITCFIKLVAELSTWIPNSSEYPEAQITADNNGRVLMAER